MELENNWWVKDGYFIDWFLTVGYPEFGDYDSRRGYGARQRTPTEVINLLLKRILQLKNTHIDETHHHSIKMLHSTALDITDFNVENIWYIDDEKLNFMDGLDFYWGIMTREESENLLQEKSCGSFLIRKSDLNNLLRVVIKGFDGVVSHVPLKKEDNVYRLGRPELKRISFPTLMDALSALELYPSFGIKSGKHHEI